MSEFDPASGIVGDTMVDEDDSIDQPGSLLTGAFFTAINKELRNIALLGGVVAAWGNITDCANGIAAYVAAQISAGLDGNDANPLVNGDMQIAQRPAANINSSAFQFGTVDRWAMKSTGTITGGGAIQQAITTLLGTGGFALQVAALSASTAGSVIARHRMESSDARRYKNVANIIIQGLAYQDTGLNQNFSISVNKANAQDNFSAVTNVGNSANIPVASGVPTPISFSIANPGDVSNGLELQIVGNFSAAIAAKNFYITDMQIHLGTRVRANCNHPSIAEALNRCRRYFLIFGDGGCGWYNNSAQQTLIPLTFGSTMRTTPVVSLTGANVSFTYAANNGVTATVVGSSSSFDQNGGTIGVGTTGAAPVSTPIQIATKSGYQADAEL